MVQKTTPKCPLFHGYSVGWVILTEMWNTLSRTLHALWAFSADSNIYFHFSAFILIPEKGNAKECSNYCTVALISHTSKVMLKILQERLQQYVNHEFPDVQARFRKWRGTRDQIANISWIIKKAREFQKNIYFCFIDYVKAFDCVDFSKPLEKSVCRSRSNS